MSSATDYGWAVLEAGVPGKDWVTAWMTLDKFHRDAVRHNKFMYGSPSRPVPERFQDENPRAVVAHIRAYARERDDEEITEEARGARSLILTPEPLDHQVLQRYELIPVSADAIGWYILELANAEKHPVELATKDGAAALLFKNPRGLWQISYFDRIGPVGHQEGMDPGKLAYEAYLTGYRRWSPGAVDMLSATFEGLRRRAR